jgi:hypothetical protein
MPKRYVEVVIEECPICNIAHTYQIGLGTTYLFRGGAKNERTQGTRFLEVILKCPTKDTLFKAEIAIPLEDFLWVAEVDVKIATASKEAKHGK